MRNAIWHMPPTRRGPIARRTKNFIRPTMDVHQMIPRAAHGQIGFSSPRARLYYPSLPDTIASRVYNASYREHIIQTCLPLFVIRLLKEDFQPHMTTSGTCISSMQSIWKTLWWHAQLQVLYALRYQIEQQV